VRAGFAEDGKKTNHILLYQAKLLESDSREDSRDFATEVIASFAASNQLMCRLIRMTQTITRHTSDDVLILYAVEFFGTLTGHPLKASTVEIPMKHASSLNCGAHTESQCHGHFKFR
jgi:hypothetical protein